MVLISVAKKRDFCCGCCISFFYRREKSEKQSLRSSHFFFCFFSIFLFTTDRRAPVFRFHTGVCARIFCVRIIQGKAGGGKGGLGLDFAAVTRGKKGQASEKEELGEDRKKLFLPFSFSFRVERGRLSSLICGSLPRLSVFVKIGALWGKRGGDLFFREGEGKKKEMRATLSFSLNRAAPSRRPWEATWASTPRPRPGP